MSVATKCQVTPSCNASRTWPGSAGHKFVSIDWCVNPGVGWGWGWGGGQRVHGRQLYDVCVCVSVRGGWGSV